jgi:hypothetical protein
MRAATNRFCGERHRQLSSLRNEDEHQHVCRLVLVGAPSNGGIGLQQPMRLPWQPCRHFSPETMLML